MPLVVNFKINDALRVFAGPQFGVLLNSKDYDRARDLDYNCIAGLGYTLPFGLDISASYSVGLNNVINHTAGSGSGSSYTSMFRVSVGYKFLKSKSR